MQWLEHPRLSRAGPYNSYSRILVLVHQSMGYNGQLFCTQYKALVRICYLNSGWCFCAALEPMLSDLNPSLPNIVGRVKLCHTYMEGQGDDSS